MMLVENGKLYAVLRSLFGLYLVLQGCVQMDVTGKAFFPSLNKFFSERYRFYVHTIPWNLIGIYPSANLFRNFLGCCILLSGLCMVMNKKVKICSIVMCFVSIWAIYAHISVKDPAYTAVCGGIITVFMIILALAKPARYHKKID